MKLLFDENSSYKLSRAMADLFPDSVHPRDIGLKATDDRVIWDYARDNGFVIVSKDSDFYQRSFLFGYPPKIIWIRSGNCSTRTIEGILRDHYADIKNFCDNAYEAVLILL